MITSLRNSEIVKLRKLKQRKYRRQQGRFVVEGLQLLRMAVDAEVYPTQVFYCEEMFACREAWNLIKIFKEQNTILTPVSRKVMESISDRDSPQGLIATFKLLNRTLHDTTVGKNDLVLVLEQLQDPGNLGTLIRTADAVGAGAVILIEPCVDVFDFKTVRSSMGSIFNLPIISCSSVDEALIWLKKHSIRIVGADPHVGADWGEGLWNGGTAIVLGNEARGLSEKIRERITHFARLPIVGSAESLNVAIAGSVLMYEWLKHNR